MLYLLKRTFFWLLLLLFLLLGSWLIYRSFSSKPTPAAPISSNTEKDWSNIHLDFKNNPQLKPEWTKRDFSYQQTQDWLNIGLKTSEYAFAEWLKKQGNQPEAVLNQGDRKKLKESFLIDEVIQTLKNLKKEVEKSDNLTLIRDVSQVLDTWNSHFDDEAEDKAIKSLVLTNLLDDYYPTDQENRNPTSPMPGTFFNFNQDYAEYWAKLLDLIKKLIKPD